MVLNWFLGRTLPPTLNTPDDAARAASAAGPDAQTKLRTSENGSACSTADAM
jgi:hypothetical protein